MQTPTFKQKFQQIPSSIASVVSVLYGSLLMRTSGAIALSAVLGGLTVNLPVYAAILEDWKIDPDTGIVEVLLPEGVRPRLSVGTEPPRLVVDLPNTEIGINLTERFESGVISQVSFSQAEPQLAQIVIEFSPGVVLDEREIDFRPIGIENLWVLRPTIVDRPEPAPQFPTAQTQQAPATVNQTVDEVDQTASESAADLEVSEATQTEQPSPPRETLTLETPQTPTTAPGFQPPTAPEETLIPNPRPAPASDIEALRIQLGQPNQPQPQTNPLLETTPSPPPTVGAQAQPVPPPPQDDTIRFGQPLPRTSQPQNRVSSRTIDRRPPNVLLTSGTQLTLRYPNPNEVRLKDKPERQEVLLLQGGIIDQEGNYIVPPNTPIVGYFETSSKGSRFIAEAINLEGRSIPIQAESGWIPGRLDPEPKNVLRDTGIGGLGLFLLTGFTGVGLLVGALGGAAVGLATSPQPTTLEPNQVIEVRLTEELRQSQFVYIPED
ncbi:AMIN domain-containing protein [Capilliphycus salinus ALCB114379]|uniref:AMIN domain-containing protein n=1 Tax=Capilliphycus salinus TaxID=2768948 RepID=UPI0039A6D549